MTSGRRAPRVLLVGGVGIGNIGNDASMDVVADMLRGHCPDVHFTIVTPFPAGVVGTADRPVLPLRQDYRAAKAVPGLPRRLAALTLREMRRLKSAVHALRSADLVVLCGTGLFDDFGEKPWTMPYGLASWALLARVTATPFVCLAVGAGPVANPVSRAEMMGVLRVAASVSYRDEVSLRYAADHGAGRRDARVVPDVVFAHRLPEIREARPQDAAITVGVGVMDYHGWSDENQGVHETYLDTLAAVVEDVVQRGHRVEFLVGQPVDLQAVDALTARCSPEARSRLLRPQISDFDGLVQAVARADVVVATRYHNVVAAVMARRPVVSLSYAAKNREVLGQMGLGEFDRPIEEADARWVLDRLTQYTTGSAGLPVEGDRRLNAWRDMVEEETRALATRFLLDR